MRAVLGQLVQEPLVLGHLVAVSAYAGFQWTVHLVVYPQFGAVPRQAFAAYERSHQRRVTRVVGPLFAAQLLTTSALVVARPAGVPGGAVAVSAALLAVVLGTTAAAAVPAHRRLTDGWHEEAYRSLRRADAVRVLAATANVAAALWLAARA